MIWGSRMGMSAAMVDVECEEGVGVKVGS